MKLIDKYMNAKSGLSAVLPWKIYDKDTRRKLSDDYGAERGEFLPDDWEVWSMTVKENKSGKQYIRVSVCKTA